jgi:HSP20 family protein
MIERYDPFGRAMSLRQMMDSLLADAFVMPRDAQASPAGSVPLNMYEEGDTLVVEAGLPGMKPEDIDVNVERGMLTIRSESKSENERKERNYLVREQRTGSTFRTVRLPDAYDADAGQATFEDGVLRLTFPKSEQARPRRIQISGGWPHAGLPGARSTGTSSQTDTPTDGREHAEPLTATSVLPRWPRWSPACDAPSPCPVEQRPT